MSRDPRDWQKDMEMCDKYGNSNMHYNVTEFSKALPYWLQQSKQLSEETAHWICKHTAAEQKYQTQSNVIADLRKRAEKAETQLEVNQYLTARAERIAKDIKEREQKLRELLEIAIGGLFLHGDDPAAECLLEKFRALYPLEREDTK